MKSLAMTICLAASFFTGGCNYVGIVGGDESFAIELYSPPPEKVSKLIQDEHDIHGAVGLLVIADSLKSDTFERTSEIGGFVKLGIEILPDTGLFVDGLVGLTGRHEYDRPKKDKTTEWEALYGGGLTYFVSDKGTCFIVSYDNRRDLAIGIGWRF